MRKVHLICDDQRVRVQTYCGRIGDKTLTSNEYVNEYGNIFEAVPVRDLDFVSCISCQRYHTRSMLLKNIKLLPS